MNQSSSPRVAGWARRTQVSALQKALAAAGDPAILSFTLGLPDPALFPTAGLAAASDIVLSRHRDALQYRLPPEILKSQICDHMAARGVTCTPDSVFLTYGAQEALSLVARLLLESGSAVLEEECSYPAFQQVIEPYSPHVIRIPSNSRSGIDVEAVEYALRTEPRPAFLYLMADGHNPLGITLSLQQRQKLAELARRFQVPVVEDDPYGFLSYDGDPLPPIRAMESEWVYYVGSFSKLLAPSLRIGWLVVPRPVCRLLAVVKEGLNINMGTFAQWVVSEYLNAGRFPAHIQTTRDRYGARRNAMHASLSESFPASCRWSIPGSGVFFWVELPEAVNATQLLKATIEHEKVAFVPAEAFSRGHRLNALRLNFTYCDESRIADGIGRIGRFLQTWTGDSGQDFAPAALGAPELPISN